MEQLLRPDIFDLLNAAISNVNLSSLVVILLGLIIYMVQTSSKRQDKSDSRYDSLVNTFINTTKKLTELHDQSLNSLKITHEESLKLLSKNNEDSFKEILKELGDIKNELKVCGVRIEETNRLFIFNRK